MKGRRREKGREKGREEEEEEEQKQEQEEEKKGMEFVKFCMDFCTLVWKL